MKVKVIEVYFLPDAAQAVKSGTADLAFIVKDWEEYDPETFVPTRTNTWFHVMASSEAAAILDDLIQNGRLPFWHRLDEYVGEAIYLVAGASPGFIESLVEAGVTIQELPEEDGIVEASE